MGSAGVLSRLHQYSSPAYAFIFAWTSSGNGRNALAEVRLMKVLPFGRIPVGLMLILYFGESEACSIGALSLSRQRSILILMSSFLSSLRCKASDISTRRAQPTSPSVALVAQ